MPLTKIPVGDDPPREINVIIENPLGGDPVKYEMDKASGAMFVDRFLHTAMYYPGNYGFVPHTLSGDGDPVDVLVIGRVPVMPGAVMRSRPVGVLVMEDEAGEDEKILAVPIDRLHPYFTDISSYTALPQILLDQISHFFSHYKDLEKGKWSRILRWGGPEEADAMIMAGIARAGEHGDAPPPKTAAAPVERQPEPAAPEPAAEAPAPELTAKAPAAESILKTSAPKLTAMELMPAPSPETRSPEAPDREAPKGDDEGPALVTKWTSRLFGRGDREDKPDSAGDVLEPAPDTGPEDTGFDPDSVAGLAPQPFPSDEREEPRIETPRGDRYGSEDFAGDTLEPAADTPPEEPRIDPVAAAGPTPQPFPDEPFPDEEAEEPRIDPIAAAGLWPRPDPEDGPVVDIEGRVEILRGDITKIAVDAIVNAANERLRGGGGVDGAIHRAAGPELLMACRDLGGCPTGMCKMTGAFDLPAKSVIHCVGPVWHGGEQDEDGLLASCYRAALQMAAEKGYESIAFPALSTGIYGFPPDRAAEIAAREVRGFLAEDKTLERIVFVCFDQDTEDHYRTALPELA